METPKTLNNYPVIKSEIHANCVTVMMDAPGKYVVATWWPALGSSWAWGHYFHVGESMKESEAFAAAHDAFREASKRNAAR